MIYEVTQFGLPKNIAAGVTEALRQMQPGDTLLLLSDGVSQKDAPKWAKFSSTTPPGALASTILKTDAATPDDATVVVVRMERKAKPS